MGLAGSGCAAAASRPAAAEVQSLDIVVWKGGRCTNMQWFRPEGSKRSLTRTLALDRGLLGGKLC